MLLYTDVSLLCVYALSLLCALLGQFCAWEIHRLIMYAMWCVDTAQDLVMSRVLTLVFSHAFVSHYLV